MERNLKDLGTGMRDFIWVLDPEKDSLRETLQRIEAFGNTLFSDTQTRFSASMDINSLEKISLDIKDKRHLLLIFKEAMNNTLKYAGASEAKLTAKIEGINFVVHYTDNGKGFDTEDKASGYGLNNMRSRAEESGASLTIHSTKERGTAITFRKEIHPAG